MNYLIKNNIPEIEKVISVIGDRIYFFGKGYHETHRLSITEIKSFIERDIFLAIKKKLIPSIECEFNFKSDENFELVAKIDFARDLIKRNNQVIILEAELTKIISNYNYTSFKPNNENLIMLMQKFNFEIKIRQNENTLEGYA